jgi:lysophospholipase L1-like esterase
VIVACLGDSITAGSPLWDPDPAVRARIGDARDERSQWQYWAALTHPELDFRNFGVYGERTDEIERRLEACADGADVLVVQGGINDIAQRRPTDRAAAHLSAMVRRGKELGLKVAIADVLPWNAGWPQAAAPIDDLNALISALAVSEEVPLLPFHDTLVDSRQPGRMRAHWTDDLDHPSITGYRRLGELAFRPPSD